MTTLVGVTLIPFPTFPLPKIKRTYVKTTSDDVEKERSSPTNECHRGLGENLSVLRIKVYL